MKGILFDGVGGGRGALFPKEAKGFSYSVELKLIPMMYMVHVCKKKCFFVEVYASILFLGKPACLQRK